MDSKEKIQAKLIENISPTPKHRRRSSFFGYESFELQKREQKQNEANLYIKKLENEFQDWPEHYLANKKKLLDFWMNDDFPREKSYLTQDQQDYLSKAINMDEYYKFKDQLADKLCIYTLKKQKYLEFYKYCTELMEETIVEKELTEVTKLQMTEKI